MNERIRELLLKVVSMEGEDGDLMPSLHTQQDIAKFAELIVRECVNVVYDGTSDSEEYENRIKKHFGVE